MLTSPDFKELLSLFKSYSVRYLVVPFISKTDLIAAKKASARPRDLLDLEKLEQ